MDIFKQSNKLQEFLADKKANGLSIGFVPTMGALHEGHLSLIKQAVEENDICVCSIFINPIQFNNSADFQSYPIDIQNDIKLLEKAGCNILFLPDEKEIYPSEEIKQQKFDFHGLDKYMEGAHRPGHFNGVAIVVKRLFEICIPHKAYFGKKDYQQLRIIEEMVKTHALPLEIIACDIMREESGLAMSSRNRKLKDEEKQEAAKIYACLKEAKENYKKGFSLKESKAVLGKNLQKINNSSIEYVEFADCINLQPITSFSETKNCILCVAVYVNKVRLIDNIILFS